MLYKNWDTQRHCQKAILNMKKKKDRNYYFIDKNVHKAIRFGFCSFFSKHMSAVNVLLHFYTFKLASDRTSGIKIFQSFLPYTYKFSIVPARTNTFVNHSLNVHRKILKMIENETSILTSINCR